MINSIGIHVKVRDFKSSCKFYQHLGFKKVFEYGPYKKVKESYSGVVFEQGGTKIEIADGHRAVRPEVFKEGILSSKVSLMIHVNSIKQVLSYAKKWSLPIAVGPRHYYWGTLELVIKDPDGLVLVFIAPYTQNEARCVNADETYASYS